MDGIIIVHELNQFYYAIVPEHLPAMLEECFSIVANVVAAAADTLALALVALQYLVLQIEISFLKIFQVKIKQQIQRQQEQLGSFPF